MIEVERVDFISIPTRDIERAKSFYGETLGLRSHSWSAEDFETSNVTLELWEPEAQGEPSSRTGTASRYGLLTWKRPSESSAQEARK